MNLRLKLFMPLVMMGALLSAYITFFWAPRYIEKEFEENAKEAGSHLDTIGESLLDPLLKSDLSAVYSTLDGIAKKNPHWRGLHLRDAGGRLVYPLDVPGDIAADHTVRNFSKKIQYLGKELGEIRVSMDYSEYLATIETRVHELMAMVTISILIGLSLVGIMVEVFLLRPMARLSAASRRLAQGDYAALLPAARNDELGALVTDFSIMRTAIERHAQELIDENARRRLVEERVTRELSAQQTLSAILHDSLMPASLPDFLGRVLDRLIAVSWLKLNPRGAVFLADDKTRALTMVAQRGLPDAIKQSCAQVPSGLCLCGSVAQSGEALVVSEVDARHMIQPEGMQPHGHCVLPIRSGETLHGVLNLYLAAGYKLQEYERFMLQDVSNTLAGVIERRNAETRLTESEGRIRTLVETTSDWVWEVDANGVYTYVSPRVHELLGYEPEEVIGRTPFDLMPPEEAERVAALFQEIVAACRPIIAMENINLHKNGARVLIETSGLPFFDAQGRLAGYRGIDRDITTRRQAEVLTQRLGRIVDQSSNEIYIFDAASLKFLQVNQGAQRNLGYSMEELYTLTPVDIKPELTLEHFEALITPLQDHTLPQVVFETVHRRKDGTTYPVEVRLQLSSNESPPVFVAIIQDISVRRRMEEDRRARDAALAASSAKSEFLATMSHEIRTPMNGVLGMASLLLNTPLNGEQREFASTIHQSGEALMHIINDILDFSRIEAGRMQLESIDFDLSLLVKQAIDLMSGAAQQKGLRLEIEIEKGLLPCRYGDPARLRQVLLNLVGNAIKFTEQGGITLHVNRKPSFSDLEPRVEGEKSGTAPACDPRPSAHDCTLRFEVADTGIGIPRDAQGLIFEPFSQADSSTTRRYGGSGLGLTIVKRLVELMGGRLGVESEHSQGSTFWFELALPVAEVTAVPPAEGLATRALPPRGVLVLVAEDSPVNQAVIDRMLRMLGCQVELVINGQEAVAAAARQSHDLVLMDCQMPEMDGYEATRQIRGLQVSHTVTRMPIIALTANAMQGDRERCLAAGMDDYLSKPVTLDALRTVLNRWCDQPVVAVSATPDSNIPPDAETGAVDWRFFLHLESLMGPRLPGLIDEFFAGAERCLTVLRSVEISGDEDAFLRAVHTFKGSCMNLGALALAGLCRSAETAVHTNGAPPASAGVAQIEAELVRLREALGSFMPNRSGL